MQLYDVFLVLSDDVYDNLGMAMFESTVYELWPERAAPEELADRLVYISIDL